MAGTRLSTLIQRPDPALAWRWWFVFSSIGQGNGSATNAFPQLGLLIFQVEDVLAPHEYIENEGAFREGRMIYYPAISSIDTMTIRFYEDINFTCYNFLNSWHRRVIDEEGNYYPSNHYKGTARAQLMDQFGTVRQVIPYEGLWPMRKAEYELVSDASQRLITSCIFSVDRSPTATAGAVNTSG